MQPFSACPCYGFCYGFAAEGSDLPELFAKDLAGRLVEEALTVYHASDAVIDGIARVHRDLDSGFTHATQEIRSNIISNLRSYFQPVPTTDDSGQGRRPSGSVEEDGAFAGVPCSGWFTPPLQRFMIATDSRISAS